MRVFDFESYRDFVRTRIKAMPRNGRGQFGKIAAHLKMHTTLVSQVFRGDKNLTLEQACLLAEYLGMGELESDYFLTLVEVERAGSAKLKRMLDKRLKQLKTQAKQVSSHLPRAKVLTDEDKAIFYSDWYYSGIRLLTSLPKYQNRDALAVFLSLPPSIIGKAVEFLLRTGLCEEESGRLRMGSSRTHISPDSPLVYRHHTNWRLKAMQRFPAVSEDEIVFTAPLTIARADVPAVREVITELIEKVSRIVEHSEPERLACLNIDWVGIVAD